MIYRVIGCMSGSSLDGLDLAYCLLEESGGNWNYEIVSAATIKYDETLKEKLRLAHRLSALDYQLFNVEYGHYTGKQIKNFIAENQLEHKVHFISSHGHTAFHIPEKMMTSQIGDGAAIAAETSLPVISDLRSLDIALGGQGAPLVPIGEKLLFSDHQCFLNIGGIANLSVHNENVIAFDVCPANRVLNMLAEEKGLEFDDEGKIASTGKIHGDLLKDLNQQDYYKTDPPKSLANTFGTDLVYLLIQSYKVSVEDAMSTFIEHIAIQIDASLQKQEIKNKQLLVTGGGAFNLFLVERMKHYLQSSGIEIIIPDTVIVQFKEVLIMALTGTLRWREEATFIASVTGANRSSVGGALWLGNDL
ncbi:anhydro-N-acetylmuramic acid kinase [soil metagenome]